MLLQISANMMEGTNEYFTREVEQSMPVIEPEITAAYSFTYPKQYEFIKTIIDVCGETVKMHCTRFIFVMKTPLVLLMLCSFNGSKKRHGKYEASL